MPSPSRATVDGVSPGHGLGMVLEQMSESAMQRSPSAPRISGSRTTRMSSLVEMCSDTAQVVPDGDSPLTYRCTPASWLHCFDAEEGVVGENDLNASVPGLSERRSLLVVR